MLAQDAEPLRRLLGEQGLLAPCLAQVGEIPGRGRGDRLRFCGKLAKCQHRLSRGWLKSTKSSQTPDASENAMLEIGLGEVKHSDVFVVGPSPRYDLFECKSHR